MATKQWYYMKEGASYGPVPEEKIVSMVHDGSLAKTSLVWAKGAANWKPVETVFDFEDEQPELTSNSTFSATAAEDNIKDKKVEDKSYNLWSESPPHPWRRYFARLLDTYISGGIIFICLGLIMYLISPSFNERFFSAFNGLDGQFFDVIVSAFLAMFLNAAFIGFTGGSLGKWFFGIRVVNIKRQRIGYMLALRREIAVFVRGLGMAIPFVSLFTLLSAQKHLLKEGNTTWDEELNLNVIYHENNTKQKILTGVGFTIFLILTAILRAQNH